MRLLSLLVLLAASMPVAQCQWEIQNSGSTADLRGVYSVGQGIAWASGTEGTVLGTTDGGKSWQRCATPPDADHLDFRGIQALDANTVTVMSSGKGSLSRVYKTIDACRTWRLVATNPDADGFWDAIVINRFDKNGYVFGDPVNGVFQYWRSHDQGTTWQGGDSKITAWKGLEALPQEGAFAASNSSILVNQRSRIGFVTGGPAGGRLLLGDANDAAHFHAIALPLSIGSATSGAYSIEARDRDHLVVAGGDYQKPNESSGTAAYSQDGGEHWRASQTPPHGYRSAVAYNEKAKTWITVGPNGTDVSADDGRTWRALHPAAGDPPDADQHWNALSLPFVAGPHGRIGKLRSDAAAP